jgi:4-alpha-glucanotransferase
VTTIYEAIQLLAHTIGVEPHYEDNWGKVHWTDPEMARHILEINGLPISPHSMSLSPQVLVYARDRVPEEVPVLLKSKPTAANLEAGATEVTLSEHRDKFAPTIFPCNATPMPLEVDEKTGLLRLSVPMPHDLDLGTYRVRVQCSIGEVSETVECVWVLCPEQAYWPVQMASDQRLTGVGIALYGVRSETNWGVGDFHDLERMIDWASQALRVDFVGVNPLHALFNRRPVNHSPYLPSSRLYHNFIYLHVPTVEGFRASLKARTLVQSAETQDRIRSLREDPQVNYEGVAQLKEEVLREVFASFLEIHRERPGTAEWRAFQEYRDAEGEHLERFATFCALHDHFARVLPTAATWRQWPAEFHDAASDAVRRFRQEREPEVLFWMYVQWQLDVQLRHAQEHAREHGMLVGLYLDQALAVDRNGADCWAWPEFFLDGFTVGAPPDAFAPDGQEWGFPPPRRDRHRASGYELFLKQLQVNCRHAGALRIDHVMQIHHLFWIPPGGRPSDGVYVKDYEEDLLNVLALASHQSRTIIIGEDLGTVPFDLRDRLMAKGVLSYRLFYFERYRDESLIPHHQYPRAAMVSIATHDLPTLAGFWSGLDIDARRDMGMLDPEQERLSRAERTRHKARTIEKLVQDGFLPAPVAHAAWESPFPTEELHAAVLRFLFSTPSAMVIVSQEDLFLDSRQQNFPGTTWQQPNWVTKMRYTVEELSTNPEAARLSAKFRCLLEESGRCADRP